MNKLIACALLGLGLTQSLVACSDDDDGVDAVAGAAGAAGTSAGTSTGGQNTGGSAQSGGTGGKGGSAGSGGTAGKAGSGGTASQGGDGVGGDAISQGGEASGGAGGGEGIGGEGAGGEGMGGAPPDLPIQTPTPRWLEHYCDAKASDTLACPGSVSWFECFHARYQFLSGDGGDGSGICPNDDPEGDFPLTVAMFGALDALAAACPDPKVEDWRCNLSGQPEPKLKACRDAEEAHAQATIACMQ